MYKHKDIVLRSCFNFLVEISIRVNTGDNHHTVISQVNIPVAQTKATMTKEL